MLAEVRAELLALAERDQIMRARLEEEGALADGYHPSMAAVHRDNADRLARIMDEHGWPGIASVGDSGADAAWLVAQHAISQPAFMRRCLNALQDAIARGDAPRWHAAFLEDRILMFEGSPQRYGTQMDIGPDGSPVLAPVMDPENLDRRRKEAGLGPVAEQMAGLEIIPGMTPERWNERQRRYEEWLRETGWRNDD